jgi:hypothetical protein
MGYRTKLIQKSFNIYYSNSNFMLKDENAEVFCQPAFDRNNTLMGKIRGDSNTRNSTTFCLGCNKG